MNQKIYTSTFKTPFGEFTVGVDASGAIVATAFGGTDALASRIDDAHFEADESRTARAREQILEYFAGERREFALKLAATGSEFQHRVWGALWNIPFGETRSYGEIARDLRSSARAVGRANATNPICVVVPCHRVVGADGALTGFAFGEDTKRRLLELEGALATV